MTIPTDAVDTAAVPGDEKAKRPRRKTTPAGVDPALVSQLVTQAREQRLQLSGEGGLLQQLTKIVLESALDGEITDHLGYDKHDQAGANSGNSRNGSRSKTVLTDVGPVQIDVPRNRAGSFEPAIVRKRQRRLSGVENLVLSLSAKGLTTGEISAHLAEVYGAEVSRQTISTIIDKVMDGVSATEPEDRRRIRTELCELRRLCGMTRQQVADSMDCSVSKIRHIEVGNVGVDQITLRALLDVYCVSDRALIAELVDLARTHRGRVRAAMRLRR